MAENFFKLRCEECGNEQNVFSRASTKVECMVCGEVLAKPSGGAAELEAEIIEELSPE